MSNGLAICEARHHIFDKGIGGCTALLSLGKLEYVEFRLSPLDKVVDPRKLFWISKKSYGK